jgi:hypothetical protein
VLSPRKWLPLYKADVGGVGMKLRENFPVLVDEKKKKKISYVYFATYVRKMWLVGLDVI